MFKPEQKVKYTKHEMPATVISGPHPTHGADRWLIRKADGKVSLVRQHELSEISDKREATAKAIYTALGSSYGYTWSTVTYTTRRKYLAAADAVLKALEPAPAPAPALRKLAAGDKIRILHDRLDHASVKRGDVLTVKAVNASYLSTYAPGYSYRDTWSFMLSGEGTGWERVA